MADDETGTDDQTDNTGCQHANMITNGLATWCADCGFGDLS